MNILIRMFWFIALVVFSSSSIATIKGMELIESAYESENVTVTVNSAGTNGTVAVVTASGETVSLKLNADTEVYIHEVLVPLTDLPILIGRPAFVFYLPEDQLVTSVRIQEQ